MGDNYCTSNADATRELTKHLVEECIAGEWREADIINFWMLDNGKWCTCDACQKQGIYTDRLMAVIDATLKALQQARREGRLKRRVQVVSLAYHETLPAPQLGRDTRAVLAALGYPETQIEAMLASGAAFEGL